MYLIKSVSAIQNTNTSNLTKTTGNLTRHIFICKFIKKYFCLHFSSHSLATKRQKAKLKHTMFVLNAKLKKNSFKCFSVLVKYKHCQDCAGVPFFFFVKMSAVVQSFQAHNPESIGEFSKFYKQKNVITKRTIVNLQKNYI